MRIDSGDAFRAVRLLADSRDDRIVYGFEKLREALETAGYTVAAEFPGEADGTHTVDGIVKRIPNTCGIFAGVAGRGNTRKLEDSRLLLYHAGVPQGEGFCICELPGAYLTAVTGGNETGLLYGLLELARLIKESGELPRGISVLDMPVFRLRGPAIGLQLTHVEPPRLTYEYPVTPERFPWFYDRALWERFLDMQAENRCNVIYLWTGQPFSSFVKLKDYPEALEVSEEIYGMNRDMLGWLTGECARRGIWLVLKFYSIHIPLPLAEKYGVELLQSRITPLNRDYTFQSIVEFIRSFPHIGLMVCLGEALRGNEHKTEWFLDTIIPAVLEGVRAAGIQEAPPLILRGHDCDPDAVMREAFSRYPNLYTMWKYNGEGLTTWLPSGKWQETHRKMASHGQTHIMNVHVLANLEPFRFCAPSFVLKCVQAGRYRLGANGLHLYPLFFWDWPYAPDRTEPRLLQPERDWMWFKMWFRYAWNPDRDPEAERFYWEHELANRYHCPREAAEKLLEALEAAGECAPRILRRAGITEGNRQTLSLGMTMSELTNPMRYRPNWELFLSASVPGETLTEYVQAEIAGKEHFGETPYDMIRETDRYAGRALKAAEEALSLAGGNGMADPELYRIETDIRAICLMTMHYNRKIEAALLILRYRYTMDENLRADLRLLQEAEKPFGESLEWYQKLAALTAETYLYANSMQTRQRKIPLPDGSRYSHWTDCLPEYEREYAAYRKNLGRLERGIWPTRKEKAAGAIRPPREAAFTLESPGCETYALRKGENLFTDMPSPIRTIAPELEGLRGIRFSLDEAIRNGVVLRLTLHEDALILIAYMNAKGLEWLQVPELETNTHADDRGGLKVLLANALQADSCPDMNVHAFRYEKGTHEIFLGTGGFVVAGVVSADCGIAARDAGLSGETLDKLDWLYEDTGDDGI